MLPGAQHVGQRTHHLERQRIERLRAVQGDDAGAVGDAGQDVVGHGVISGR